MNYIEQLDALISASVSPYHCIMAASDQLKNAGFKELPLAAPWNLQKGEAYYINVFDSTLIAFSVGCLLYTSPSPRDCS